MARRYGLISELGLHAIERATCTCEICARVHASGESCGGTWNFGSAFHPGRFSIALAWWKDPREPMMAEAQAALFDLIDGALARAKEIQAGPKKANEIGSLNSLAETQGGSSYEGCAMWEMMRSDRWSPSELSMVFNSFSVAGIYFVSHIERPNRQCTHETYGEVSEQDSSKKSRRKPRCTNRHCSIYQLDQDSYTTMHASGCTGCEEIGVDDDELLSILR